MAVRKTAAAKPATPKPAAKKKAAAAKPAKANATATLKKPAARKPAAKKSAASVAKPFAAQKAAASAKELLLFELERGRVAVHSALHGISPANGELRVRDGGWTIREVVLHLIARDKVRLEEFERALGGTPVSWTGISAEHLASINEWHLGELRHLSWDEAMRLLEHKREELMSALRAVPAEPADVWSKEHAFGSMLWRLPEHDRHHAAQVKAARIEG